MTTLEDDNDHLNDHPQAMLPVDAPTSNISQPCEPDDEEQMRQPQLQQEGELLGEGASFSSLPSSSNSCSWYRNGSSLSSDREEEEEGSQISIFLQLLLVVT